VFPREIHPDERANGGNGALLTRVWDLPTAPVITPRSFLADSSNAWPFRAAGRVVNRPAIPSGPMILQATLNSRTVPGRDPCPIPPELLMKSRGFLTIVIGDSRA